MRKRIHFLYYSDPKIIPSYRFYFEGKDLGLMTWKDALKAFPKLEYQWIDVSYIHGIEYYEATRWPAGTVERIVANIIQAKTIRGIHDD